MHHSSLLVQTKTQMVYRPISQVNIWLFKWFQFIQALNPGTGILWTISIVKVVDVFVSCFFAGRHLPWWVMINPLYMCPAAVFVLQSVWFECNSTQLNTQNSRTIQHFPSQGHHSFYYLRYTTFTFPPKIYLIKESNLYL